MLDGWRWFMGHFDRFDKLTTHKLRLHYVSSGQAGMECWIGGVMENLVI